MTEQEWFHEPDPQGLLEYIGERLSGRKVRLFAVACCRTMSSFLNTSQQRALHVAENHADGLEDDNALLASIQAIVSHEGPHHGEESDPDNGALERALHVALYTQSLMDWYVSGDKLEKAPALIPYAVEAFSPPFNYAIMTSIYLAHALASIAKAGYGTPVQDEILRGAFDRHARILRDIVGNPFNGAADKVAAISRSSPHIRLFAARLYLSSSFYDVPFLAKLVYDEGFRSSPIVEAMQADVGHVKGCWLVDAAAGLE